MRLARGYRLHEAIGLHDLKVVVSHGNARSRLEPPELAVTRCHIPSHEGGVLIVLIKAELQLAHPPEIPRQSASITVHLDPVAALLAHRSSAGLKNSPGASLKAQQGSDVVLVFNLSHRAACPAREVGCGHADLRTLGDKDRVVADQLADLADEVAAQVHAMA